MVNVLYILLIIVSFICIYTKCRLVVDRISFAIKALFFEANLGRVAKKMSGSVIPFFEWNLT